MKVKFYYRHATLIFSCSYITSLTLFGSLFYFLVVSSFSRSVCPENQREKIILFEIQTEREKKRNFSFKNHALLFSTSTLTLSEESQRLKEKKALLHKAFSLFIFFFFSLSIFYLFSRDLAVRRLGDHSVNFGFLRSNSSSRCFTLK